MPYLSRVWLNPLRTGAQALLRNPEKMHAAVLGGIARQPITERVLWRLDTHAHRPELLVLTDSRPSWEHIVEQAGWPNAEDPQALVRDYQPLLDRIQTGREFGFRLRANPVAATRNPASPSAQQKEKLTAPRPRGVRVAHRTAAHQLDWLTSRIDKWGFTPLTSPDDLADTVPMVRLSARERLVFFKHARDADTPARRVVLSVATFEGALRVTDPELARHTLLAGVGAAKAYGCGLLTLAPLTSDSGG
ncbi:type I-E CRISPR-associated protein Cas6/Cse3/CasE [Frankia sp. CNm7]|uniref:Type I-E CRISPR-associated protein Cas6/Cse3/CasE n=1 Tax=Frankia nepalensis TaxID=1836974 RepID=A0A937UQF4_9ACTN|nr:type I-E CRISPR-associated protein Cas6/Cse3/CasE [Frankia nepalensis]MBL7498286.1 type I-E CRISPR-associated protein Cas6/Cse3/CasE [Frankia nepalensis]MBL7509122.1 type I-E CRISPR-associated protein Cas6/Cse3/CasE [Frankia nepalensis]MBL7520808.1 type I-E CRISPR-associated protein Cas6/Cse3/CasE [Frankia nepalensis]MBL7630167.1 type I-E CRISPR-associated protein Cas6/Cse3/CasE [Frankia nepalensis]